MKAQYLTEEERWCVLCGTGPCESCESRVVAQFLRAEAGRFIAIGLMLFLAGFAFATCAFAPAAGSA